MEVDLVDDHTNSNHPPHVMQGVLSEITVAYQSYVQKLFSDDSDLILEGIREIKNFVIGNNKQKTNFIVLGVVPRLVYLIQPKNTDFHTKTQCAVLLGSLAKGMDANVKSLLDYHVMDVMFYGIQQPDLQLYEACLRCVRTIVTSDACPDGLLFNSPAILAGVLCCINKSVSIQEYTCEILTHCCKTAAHQNLLHELGAINSVTHLLTSTTLQRVRLKALQSLSVLCYKNIDICKALLSANINSVPVMQVLTGMLSRCEETEVQLNAAKCLTYMYRSGALKGQDNSFIYMKVLPCLVRMCDSSCDCDVRVTGASTVAYLMEADPSLQRLALICEQFPKKLEQYFRRPSAANPKDVEAMKKFKNEMSRSDDLICSAYLAYAALLSNDEDMRKQVTTESLAKRLIDSLDSGCCNVRVASLQCLLSLSRSVHILRTVLEDCEIWKPVCNIVQRVTSSESTSSLDEIEAVSALVCNLLLEFSPSKTKLLQSDILNHLKQWCSHSTSANVRRNGIWGFLNVSFQAELKLKLDVMSLLGEELLFSLVTSGDYDTVSKVMGVLNNILTTKQHTDAVMALHGDVIMQACAVVIEMASSTSPIKSILADHHSPEYIGSSVQTHAMCVLNCVAAGDIQNTVKKFIVQNDSIIAKLVTFLCGEDNELKTAAVACITTLCRSDDNLKERINKLREAGVVEKLMEIQQSCQQSPLADR